MVPVMNVHGVTYERQNFEAKLSKGDVTLKRTEVGDISFCSVGSSSDAGCASGVDFQRCAA